MTSLLFPSFPNWETPADPDFTVLVDTESSSSSSSSSNMKWIVLGCVLGAVLVVVVAIAIIGKFYWRKIVSVGSSGKA